MANQINLRFTTERKDLGLSLKATIKGSTKSNYKKVDELVNPDYNFWNQKQQQFNQASADAIHNNEVLQKMRSYYLDILDNYDIEGGKDLFAFNPLSCKRRKGELLTLGEFLNNVILEGKTECIKKPSKNYQNYITLLHKLEIEGNIINIPLSEVNDDVFTSFGHYVLTKLNGVNYLGLMKWFHALIVKAHKKKLNSNVLTYNYREDAPKNTEKDLEDAIDGVNVLTIEQYQKFCSMDFSIIPHGNKKQLEYMEMYRDFCVFLYEIKSRPTDVLLSRFEQIKKGDRLVYIPEKKKNSYKKKDIVSTPLSEIALNIVNKYRGKSSQGYIFPFTMNEYSWDLKDAVGFQKWFNRKQRTLEQINAFLHKLEDYLGCDNLTIYVFRHSTFTHKINEGYNIMKLAKEGGTSVKMLEDHYYNYILE